MKTKTLITVIILFTLALVPSFIGSCTKDDYKQVTIDSVMLSAPENLKAETTHNSVALTWNAVEGATGYDVQIGSSSFGHIMVTEPQYDFIGLRHSTEYTWRVRATAEDKEPSIWVSGLNFTTKEEEVEETSE